MYARWVEFIHEYNFVLKHQYGIENKVIDAFSRIIGVLQSLINEVVGFDKLKDEMLYFHNWKYEGFIH